jgi:hypothetical protein
VLTWLARVALLVGSFEVASCAGLVAAEAVLPGNVVDLFLARHFAALEQDDYREEFLTHAWDPDLGWTTDRADRSLTAVNAAGVTWRATYDPDGARHAPLPRAPFFAAAYGDSFTHCSEVDDGDTWPVALAQQLDVDVRNYGVGGYGTGQALLRMEGHLRAGRVAPVLILAIYERNVERVSSAFRPLYSARTNIRLGFKPSFRSGPEGGLRVVPNAYDDPQLSLSSLRDLADSLVESDYWASQKAELEFPYTLNLVRLFRFHLRRGLSRGGAGEGLYDPRTEPGRVMRGLVARFVDDARRVDSVPLLLLIPDKKRLRDGRPPSYTKFRKHVQASHPSLVIVDVADADFDAERFHVVPFKGHASAYGNTVIGEILAERIRNLVPYKQLQSPAPTTRGA